MSEQESKSSPAMTGEREQRWKHAILGITDKPKKKSRKTIRITCIVCDGTGYIEREEWTP